MAMSPEFREHYQRAHTVAQEFGLLPIYFEHEGDPRIRLISTSDKLAPRPINQDYAVAWIASFYPQSVIVTLDYKRVIISLGPTQHSSPITGQSESTSDRSSSQNDS